ncbi:MAG TPA: PQQ-binding-like beta-propeller repeat protein [Pyrinomonadaceae bacterium]|nr:PQQ-binding-like beta-propeller repeat protein [Pyrinomonadaceae bacterium]
MFCSWLRTILFSIFLLATVTVTAADWPQWRGPNRDGKVADERVPTTWPKALKEEWKVTVGIGHSSPVVANQRIYVFARQGEEEVLLCLDAISGRELWRSRQAIAYEMNPAAREHGKGPKSTPLVTQDNVYTLGITGILSCLDAKTGTVKWRREFSQQYPATSPLYGTAMSPLIDGDLIIVHVGGHDKGALTAFNAETGAVKWANEIDGPAYSSPIVTTLAGIKQVVTVTQKNFVGVEAATGQLLWRMPAKTSYDTNSVTPLVYKDTLILSTEEQGLIAIRLVKNGSQLVPQQVWSNKEIELYLNTPVVQDNMLFGFSVRQRGQFFSVDADTGKIIWRSQGRSGENAAILNLGGKALLLLTNDANLIVQPVAATSFVPVAQYTVATSPTWAHPVFLGNRILVKDETTLASLRIS